MSQDEDEVPFHATPGFGVMTGEAFVTLEFGTMKGQVSTDECRIIGLMLIDVAGEADAEAALAHTLEARGAPRETIAAVIQAMREEHEKMRSGRTAP